MTEYISKQNLKQILASKMAEFSSAMDTLKAAETEALFADITAKRSEQRMNEFVSMVSKWENIKADSNAISSSMAESLISAAMSKINSIMYNVRSLEAKKAKLEGQARDEAFKLLDTGIESIKKGLESIDGKLESVKDPAERAALLEKKEKLGILLNKAESIKDIKDDREAMKAFYEFSREAYVMMNPEQGKYTEEELKAKLDAIQPQGDSVFDYFKGIKGVWGLFKEGMTNARQAMEAKAEQIKAQQASMGDQEQQMKAQQEELKKEEESILGKLADYGVKGAAVVAATGVLGPVGLLGSVAAGGTKLISSLLGGEEEEKDDETQDVAASKDLADLPPEKREEVLQLQAQRNAIVAQRQQLEEVLNAMDQEKENIAEQVKVIDETSAQFDEMDKKFNSIDKSFENIDSNMSQLDYQYNEITERRIQAIKQNVNINNIKASSEQHSQQMQKEANEREFSIQSKRSEIDKLNVEINNIHGNLEFTEDKSRENKNNALNKADHLAAAALFETENKDLYIKKLGDFIKSTADDETKIVIDKSLAGLYDDLAKDLGEDRVVVDKRTGSRRSGSDRRFDQKQSNTNSTNFSSTAHNRADIAGRRKGDRRSSNHLFISEDTVKKLNIQS